MSSLSTDAARARMAEQDIKRRLIISPLLEQSQAKAGQASIDVRLGFDFRFVTASSFGFISEFANEESQQASFHEFYRPEYVPFGGNIVIHPHQFILAQTLEYIRLPPDLMAYVVGRSTWGRMGLIVATAVGIHPGFAGNLTLELRNLGETPLKLFPGQTIAQLFFHNVVDERGKPAVSTEGAAQYAGSVDIVPKKISSSTSYKTLKKIIERHEKASKL